MPDTNISALSDTKPDTHVGVVIIGRNEGLRLRHCISSVVHLARRIVYVDSGSTDDSALWAKEHGACVVNLDLARPFTAARARNEGFAQLLRLEPNVPFVQFVDGDCEVAPEWLGISAEFLATHPKVAAVCGRRRERSPQHSIYNLLCDVEWDSPIGVSRSCGGDVMMRTDAFSQSGGFRDSMIAGEEPELCVRLRSAGWEIWRLKSEMTMHDAAMERFSQWWRRSKRCGHAYAEGAWLHGSKPEHHCVKQTFRAIAWGGILPIAGVVWSLANPLGLLLFLVYPVQLVRLTLIYGITNPVGRRRALFNLLARFPECQGVVQFWLNRLRQKRTILIEYK